MIPGVGRVAKEAVRQTKRTVNHWRCRLLDHRPKVLVLLYHRVLPEGAPHPLGTVMGVETFIRQVEAIARRYAVCTLHDVARGSRVRRGHAVTYAVFTFDDGYRDNYDIVFPLLRRKGIPATFFVPTDSIDAQRPPWDWELVNLISTWQDLRQVTVGEEILRRRTRESQVRFALRVFQRLRWASTEVQRRALDTVRKAAGETEPSARSDLCVTWEQLRTMRRGGMDIGSHAASHRSLVTMSLQEATEEIRRSKAHIEQELGDRCSHFSFPFGAKRDFNEALVSDVREAGYETCCLNIHGYNDLSVGGVLPLKRIVMTTWSNPATLLG